MQPPPKDYTKLERRNKFNVELTQCRGEVTCGVLASLLMAKLLSVYLPIERNLENFLEQFEQFEQFVTNVIVKCVFHSSSSIGRLNVKFAEYESIYHEYLATPEDVIVFTLR